MIRRLVHYRIKANAIERVQQAVIQFVDDIRANEPNTVYGAFIAADGRSFFHMMAFPDDETAKRHRSAAHTKRFIEFLYSDCEEEPHVIQLGLIRSTKEGGGFLGMG